MKSCFRSVVKHAGWVVAGMILITSATHAQSAEESERIQLMADALRARESGNLELAKSRLEALLRLDPDNANVQRMLGAVNADLERQLSDEQTVYGRGSSPAPEAAPASERDEVEAAFTSTASERQFAKDYARTALEDARQLYAAGRYVEADRRLADAEQNVPVTAGNASLMNEIRDLRSKIFLKPAYDALREGEINTAEERLREYRERFGNTKQAEALESAIESARRDPSLKDPAEISPEFIAKVNVVDRMIVTARARMMIGDYEGALELLRRVEARDPENPEAKALQVEILEYLDNTAYLDHQKTREEMLREVSRQWQRPQVFDRTEGGVSPPDDRRIRERLGELIIPRIEFNGAPLSRVVATLSELTVDESVPTDIGINIVMGNSADANVPVTIRLRGASMEEILNIVTQSVGFSWDIRDNIVFVEPSGSGQGDIFLETDFFPISRGTFLRMTGGGSGSGSSAPADPFASADPFGGGTTTGGGGDDPEQRLQGFFQRAGIDFENTPGATLAYDGSQIIVTQTPRNLERMRRILRNYDETNQVEIEAKFLEVQQGALDEFGFNWSLATDNNLGGVSFTAGGGDGRARQEIVGASGNSSLNSAFGIDSGQRQTTITNQPSIDNLIPELANAVDLGQVGGTSLSTLGIIGGVEVGLMIDALSRTTGSDLLSSPRVTVLSGRTAEIVVAQELIYPENYGEAEIEVDSGGSGDNDSASGSSAAVAPGAPEDFTVRNVGVEMEVTPTVEQNGNISLELEPQVTEFEGFIEYGGTNVAIAGGITITTPSGFLQPIFSTRRVRTNVTVFDGATVVIGGLVREEVLTVDERIPLLGDLPLLGRLFRNEGETTQKRNLLIFTTANLISPGGSTSRQNFRSTNANALFQNPIVVTPGGSVSREVREFDEAN